MAYCWQFFEKICLAVASILIWFPVIWAFFLPDIMAFLNWIMSWFSNMEGHIFEDIIFSSYIIFCLVVHSFIFGLLAYIFPAFYILPVWGLMLYSFYLSAQKNIFYLIHIDDVSKFYYFENGENRYQYYTATDIYLLILNIIFLIILYRPALFYIKALWRKRQEF